MYLSQDQKQTNSVKTKQIPTFKFGKPVDDIDRAIQAFLTGRTGKFGKYVATANALVYRTILTEKHGRDMEMAQNICAIRIEKHDSVVFIGNSSVLPLIGRTVSFGHERTNRQVSEVQTRLSQYVQMVPFTVFMESGLNLLKINILDRGPEETVTRNEMKYNEKTKKDEPTPVDVHFTGASLFEVDGKVFLFDIDRREVKHKIFNPFLVELVLDGVMPKSISQAYDMLKPQAVKNAEANGLKVLRQGEWFFIPVDGEYEPVKAAPGRWDKRQYEPLSLQAGNNRPNNAQKYHRVSKTVSYVTGEVTHSGREHAPIMLKGWYLPVPNTSVQSFTLTGDVD